jgi:hypothetical protein
MQASVSGIPLTALDQNNRPYTTKESSYHDSLYLFGYGKEINSFLTERFNRPISGKAFLGITGKYYSRGVPKIAYASGFNADLGLLYFPDKQWSWGLTYKNILNTGSLGKINWNTGAEDELPSSLILGTGFRPDPDWVMLLDLDMSLRADQKGLIHLGTEYLLSKSFLVRAGWKQIPDTDDDNDIENAFSLGFSLNLAGLTVDYGYEPFVESNTVSHLVSIGYSF